MKIHNFFLRFSGGAALAFILLFTAAGFGADEVSGGYCELSLQGCPQDYDGLELVVPLDVVAISTKINACGIKDTVAGAGSAGGGAPAIMFLIDHSLSMRQSSSSGNDVNGNRFRVTLALIDTISKVYPNASVGIAIFAEGLVLNGEWDPNLVPFDGVTHSTGGANQSYLPLKPLSERALGGGYATGNSQTWLDLINGMFSVPANQNNRSTLRNGATGANVAEISGTNISIAFEAALKEFEKANATGASKGNQYIIFLSDGEPQLAQQSCSGNNSNNPRCAMQNNFRDSVKNTPATYTVFLTNTTPPAPPAALNDMTDNIRSNGYSESNPSSDIWAMSSNYSGLLTMMMENIISPMLSQTSGEAKSITITSAGVVDSSKNIDNNFTFRRQLPLDTAEITAVNMGIHYRVDIDTTVYNYNNTGRDTTYRVRTVSDSLFNYAFTVRRSANANPRWRELYNVASHCENRPTLDLQYGGASLVGKEVKGFMDVLTVQLNNSNGLFVYDNVVVQVLSATGSDLETFTLIRGANNVWTFDFSRVVATAKPNDKTLQHNALDSIIVIFRNPSIPLDTLRISVPFVSINMAFYDKPGDPKNHNPLPDTVKITAGATQDIYLKFFKENGEWDSSFENTSSKITWTVSEPKKASLTANGVHGAFYCETAGVYIVTATYREGALTLSRSITVVVEPGVARYLEVVFDTLKIEAKTDTSELKRPKTYEFEKGVSETTFYVVERDKFGNLIGFAGGANWFSDNGAVSATAADNGFSALIKVDRGNTNIYNDNKFIEVKKGDLISTVAITVVGAQSVAIGPNPFVPGRDSPSDVLAMLDRQYGANTSEYYKNILEGKGVGGSSVNGGGNRTGALIAATAPRSIKIENGRPRAAIVIYDAVGKIVFRSKPGDIAVTEDKTTFGLIWDGKNMSGRTVGPGTYLVKMVGTQSNGSKFSSERMIGVTVSK